MKVTFRAPLRYSPARMNAHARAILNDTGMALPLDDAVAVYYYCLGLESMALGIHWDVQNGTIDMEVPVLDNEKWSTYFDVSTQGSSIEPDGISSLLSFCVDNVPPSRVMRYFDD